MENVFTGDLFLDGIILIIGLLFLKLFFLAFSFAFVAVTFYFFFKNVVVYIFENVLKEGLFILFSI